MTAQSRVAELLARTKWGESFAPEEIETIAAYMTVHEVSEGTVLFHEGDDQRSMAFIVEGEVEISKASKDNTEKIVVRLSA
ncbi:MAG: cyclic nucleotide-binding domain-containing protein, partial [Proteobacteria bacterium]|nr:cyclic nucleotide-binding domain-containing protein [Pseudomonadota bacterium]